MDDIPFRFDRAALAYLRTMHEDWVFGQDTFGDAVNVALARLVLIGWMEHRLADFKSLAQDLLIPRQEVVRRCVLMERAGWVLSECHASYVIVRPTMQLIQRARLSRASGNH